MPSCLKRSDPPVQPEGPRKRTSVDVRQPLQLPSTSRHQQPLPVPSQTGCKGRKPVPGGESMMPPGLFNELNSVLNKTGRSAKNNE